MRPRISICNKFPDDVKAGLKMAWRTTALEVRSSHSVSEEKTSQWSQSLSVIGLALDKYLVAEINLLHLS